MFTHGNVFKEQNHNGWIYGHFMPEGLQKNDRVEIKITKLDKSFSSSPHYSKISTKLDIIWEGEAIWEIDSQEVKMTSGDYVIIPPNVKVGIKKILSDNIIVQTIKTPSVSNDKFSD